MTHFDVTRDTMPHADAIQFARDRAFISASITMIRLTRFTPDVYCHRMAGFPACGIRQSYSLLPGEAAAPVGSKYAIAALKAASPHCQMNGYRLRLYVFVRR